MDILGYAATDVGRQREQNEDNFLLDPKLKLFVVADGMGGHAAGEVASRIAVHELSRAVRAQRTLIEKYSSGSTELPSMRAEVLSILERAVQQACATVHRAAEQDPDKKGMATTTCALLFVGDRGFITHVGDSRIYLLRQGQVHQITEDHSLINELVKRGKVKRDEIDSSPYAKFKNAVTRAVGAHETVEADTLDFDVLPGDQFLLCSDGMYAYLEENTLNSLLGEGATIDTADVPRKLVQIANDGGGHDNITAVIVKVQDKGSQAAAERASDIANKVDVLRGMQLFKHLGYKEIIRILNATAVREYQPSDPVIVEGETGEELFVILGGKVRLHKGEAFITKLERGATFGEMALIDRSPRSLSVTAEDPTRMLILHRREFYEIIRKEPPLATKLLWSFVQALAERLRKTTAELSGARLEAQAEDLSDAVFEGDD